MDIKTNVWLGRAVALVLSIVRLIASVAHSIGLAGSRRRRLLVRDAGAYRTPRVEQGDAGHVAASEGVTPSQQEDQAPILVLVPADDEAPTSLCTPQSVASANEFAQPEAECVAQVQVYARTWPVAQEAIEEEQVKPALVRAEERLEPESVRPVRTPGASDGDTAKEQCEEPEATEPPPQPEAGPERPDELQATEADRDEHREAPQAAESTRAKRRPARPEARAARRVAAASVSSDQAVAPRVAPRAPVTVRPQLVCWREAQSWKIGVVVPEGTEDEEVSLDGVPLQVDPLAVWHEGPVRVLDRLTGTLSVRTTDEAASPGGELTLPGRGYLVFRLRASDQDRGMHVQRPASPGQYLVVVPTTWKPNEARTTARRLLATPEHVWVPGYHAYRFVVEQLPAIVDFQADKGNVTVIDARKSGFCLVGTRLQDGVGRWGPLFGSDPLGVKALAVPWESVAFIVVGEEGRGTGEWRQRWDIEQPGSDDVVPLELNASAGWYFVRFYDKREALLDSLDFRFVRGLKEMRAVSGVHPLPGEGGYSDACVEVVYEAGEVEVRPAGDSAPNGVSFETLQGRTVIRIPPDPRADWSEWQVGPSERQVALPLLVERVWWMLGTDSAQPAPDSEGWADKPLFVRPEDVRASSSSVIWLRMPRPGWVRRVRVGFSRAKARLFPVYVDVRVCSVPLREFASASELETRSKQLALRLWVDKDLPSGGPTSAVIAVVAPRASLDRSSPGVPHGQGVGRKRRALAVATVSQGSGVIRVNGQILQEYLAGSRRCRDATAFVSRLLEAEGMRHRLSGLDISVKVQGARRSPACQCRAIAHAVARAVALGDRALASSLRKQGFGGVRVRVRDLPPWAKEMIQGDSG